MELVLRMRRYMADHDQNMKVTYIPDPLCWTEVPSDIKSMRKQRTRWTRGLIESLRTHRKMFFNSNYGRLGLLGYPYWFFFEWMAPLIAFSGFIYTIYLIIRDALNWPFYLLLSFLSILLQYASLRGQSFLKKYVSHYRKKRDVLKLIGVALFEPFFILSYIFCHSGKS